MPGNRIGPSLPRGGAVPANSTERSAQGGGTSTPAGTQGAASERPAGLPSRSPSPSTGTPSGANAPAGNRLYQHMRATNSDAQAIIGGSRRAAERALARLAPAKSVVGRAGQPPHPQEAAGQAPALHLPTRPQAGRVQDSQRHQSQLGELRDGALDALQQLRSQLQPPQRGRAGQARNPSEDHGPASAAGFGSIFPSSPGAQQPTDHAAQPSATTHSNPLAYDRDPQPMPAGPMHNNAAFEPATNHDNPLAHDRDPQPMPRGSMHTNPAFGSEEKA
jgi:hypothetical protein